MDKRAERWLGVQNDYGGRKAELDAGEYGDNIFVLGIT